MAPSARVGKIAVPEAFAPNADWPLRFSEESREALAQIYAERGGQLYRYLLSRVRSPADACDLTQQVFMTALRERTQRVFSGVDSVEGFLFGIAKNLTIHRFRGSRVHEAGLETRGEERFEFEERLAARDAQNVVEGFVRELSPRDRDFFTAHMTEGCVRRPTSAAFSMTEDQVRYRERRLRERALAYLKKAGYLD